ncbi:hypothetical protein GLYMA_05G090550v4 [Glycine max]|nr:hypothetical protein GLYMA_05G090550v4 [Glycine max]KAH1133422.1 hypothetical protein GYH30_012009 [Glycine max]
MVKVIVSLLWFDLFLGRGELVTLLKSEETGALELRP